MDHKEFLTKHELPPLAELTAELGKLEDDEEELLKTLTNRLLSKFEKYTSFLEDTLHPDSTITSMQEATMFSNKEREEIFELFRKMTYLERKFLVVNLSTKEEEQITYFKELYTFFIASKEQLITYVKQAISVWTVNDVPKVINEGYFG